MLRYIACALATYSSIAAMILLAPTASAELPMHPPVSDAGPNADDFGPNMEEEPGFGSTVLIRNELAFIGMPSRGPDGRVGVFAATATDLSRTGTLTPSDRPRFGSFGRSLAYRDGILVVGAAQAAYVFQRSNGVWKQRQKLTPLAADNENLFVDSLHYADGTLAIGASSSDVPGAVYIYERNTAGKFGARGKLVSTDGSPIGGSISMAGPVMVVGGAGAAHIFRRNSAGVWRHAQTLIANELGFGGGFGAAVAIDRGMIIVGAPGVPGEFPDDPSRNSGAAYGFILDRGVYVETFKLKPRPDEIREYFFFGQRVAMFDQRVVVAAEPYESSDGIYHGTAVFTYTRTGSSVTARVFTSAGAGRRRTTSTYSSSGFVRLCESVGFSAGNHAGFAARRSGQPCGRTSEVGADAASCPVRPGWEQDQVARNRGRESQ